MYVFQFFLMQKCILNHLHKEKMEHALSLSFDIEIETRAKILKSLKYTLKLKMRLNMHFGKILETFSKSHLQAFPPKQTIISLLKTLKTLS